MKYNPAQITTILPTETVLSPRQERVCRERIARDLANMLVHTASPEDLLAYHQAFTAAKVAQMAFRDKRNEIVSRIAERKF